MNPQEQPQTPPPEQPQQPPAPSPAPAPAPPPTSPQPIQPQPAPQTPVPQVNNMPPVQTAQSFEASAPKSRTKLVLLVVAIVLGILLVIGILLVPSVLQGIQDRVDEQSAQEAAANSDWSQEVRDTYMQSCVGGATSGGTISSEVATDYCQCTLTGMEAEYTEAEFAEVEQELLKSGLDGNPVIKGIFDRCVNTT